MLEACHGAFMYRQRLCVTNTVEHVHEYSPYTSESAVLVHWELSSLYWLGDLRGYGPDGARRTAGCRAGFTDRQEKTEATEAETDQAGREADLPYLQ